MGHLLVQRIEATRQAVGLRVEAGADAAGDLPLLDHAGEPCDVLFEEGGDGADVPDVLVVEAVGAQGGDAVATVRAGLRSDGPIIVNSSRAVLYASQGADFGAAARAEALRTRAVLQAACT